MGQLGVYLPAAGRPVKQGRKGHKKDIENAPCSGAGRRLRLLFERISRLSSQPPCLAWRPWPSAPFLVRTPLRPVPLPANCNDADDHLGRARPGSDSFASFLSGSAAMALAGDAARSRRRALRVFLIALIAAAGFVFAAQAAQAAGSANGSDN